MVGDYIAGGCCLLLMFDSARPMGAACLLNSRPGARTQQRRPVWIRQVPWIGYYWNVTLSCSTHSQRPCARWECGFIIVWHCVVLANGGGVKCLTKIGLSMTFLLISALHRHGDVGPTLHRHPSPLSFLTSYRHYY